MKTNKYYIGWDVGAWHCDKNRASRDALAIINEDKKQIGISRENFRYKLNNANDFKTFIESIINNKFQLDEPFDAYIAIDTPLGFPKSVLNLITKGETIEVPQNSNENSYLFRETELNLIKKGFQPLSLIKDMIGSQCTKGIHFLRKFKFKNEGKGYWILENGENKVTAIETYPTPCYTSTLLKDEFKEDFKNCRSNLSGKEKDLFDASICSFVAWMFANNRNNLNLKDNSLDSSYQDEGWIWLPEDIFKKKLTILYSK